MNILLLICYVGILCLYFPLNRRPSKYYFPSIIDKNFPFIPETIWIYYLYYLLHPIAILATWNTYLGLRLIITLIISSLLSSFIWWLFPNGVRRPTIKNPRNLSQVLTKFTFEKDNDSNGLPSGHIFHSIICCYFLILQFPNLNLFITTICIAICISTITTKQHYIIDYVLTVPLTLIFLSFSQRFI